MNANGEGGGRGGGGANSWPRTMPTVWLEGAAAGAGHGGGTAQNTQTMERIDRVTVSAMVAHTGHAWTRFRRTN
jgi:hypothetical protein